MIILRSTRTCLRKYVDFSGRASLAEFWGFFLVVLVATLGAVAVDIALALPTVGSWGLTRLTLFVAAMPPQLAAGSRRLHDVGRSGWWQLLFLVPCVGLGVLAMQGRDGQPEANRFGPVPD